jgi:DNA-binding GntR family transcriptional regulator
MTDPAQAAVWSDSDRIFHRQIAVVSGNPIFLSLYDYMSVVMSQPLWRALRERTLFVNGGTELHVAQHRQIYEAITQGDEEAAAFYATRHVRQERADMELGA